MIFMLVMICTFAIIALVQIAFFIYELCTKSKSA